MRMDHSWNKMIVATVLAVGVGIGGASISGRRPAPHTEPLDLPVRMEERWSTDAGGWPKGIARLPSPGETQKKRNCDAELGETEVNGGCWMKTDVPPPCPPGKLWEHEGRCWRPIPQSARLPTTGAPRPGGVAEP